MVALSGGSFQNRLLLEGLSHTLEGLGLQCPLPGKGEWHLYEGDDHARSIEGLELDRFDHSHLVLQNQIEDIGAALGAKTDAIADREVVAAGVEESQLRPKPVPNLTGAGA